MRNKIFLTLVLSTLGLFATTNTHADSITATKPTVQKKYTGKPITIDFQDIPVRAILQLLADFTDLNMVVLNNSVQGNFTLRLHKVPWDQALDAVLTSQGLGIQIIGNVATVAPLADIERLNRKLQVKNNIK